MESSHIFFKNNILLKGYAREKGRYLTQSYDKSPYTDGKIQQEAQRATYRAPEYNVPHLLPHLCFLIGPKNTNFVEDIEILLSINFQSSSK